MQTRLRQFVPGYVSERERSLVFGGLYVPKLHALAISEVDIVVMYVEEISGNGGAPNGTD